MFILRHDETLFPGDYVLFKSGEQYWALYQIGSIMALEPPRYNFAWPTITEERLKATWPSIWKTYQRHKFILELKNG